MRVKGFFRIGSGRLLEQRTLIVGMKSLDDGGDRTPSDANSVNARRSVVACSQERVGHAREADGIDGSFWPLQLSLLNGKGMECV
jgi:hypothetical protein